MKESTLDHFAEQARDGLYRLVYRGPDDELPAVVFDTIEILYKNAPMKPFIFKKRHIVNPQQLQQYKTLLLDSNDDLPKVKADKEKPKLKEKAEKKQINLPTKDDLIKIKKRLTPEEILRFIMHRPKKKQTWFLVIHLPPGIEYSEFKSKEKHFATAVGGSAEIERIGEAVYLTVSNIRLEREYPFIFDPRPYLKKMSLPLFLGYSVSGPVVVDIAELVTILVGGLRGAGKSVLLHGAIYSLLRLNTDPNSPHVVVFIIDPKIKEFRYFENYGAIWVHELDEAAQLLEFIDNENTRRQNVIGGKANNILEYHALGKELPFIVLVVDEVADLGEHKTCKFYMNKAVRKYRSQGIYVLAATQRPSAKVWGNANEFSEFKSQFEARISYRMADPVNSQIILDSDKAAYLPKIPGRAIYKYDSETEIQSPYFPSKAKSPDLFYSLMDQLPKIPLPYHDIEGEVHEHDPLYPRPKAQTRQQSLNASQSLRLLVSGTHPLA